MNILLIISFLMITLTAGYLLKDSLSGVLPFVWCGLVCILYLLSFGRALNLIDIILPAVAILLFLAVLFGIPGGKRGSEKLSAAGKSGDGFRISAAKDGFRAFCDYLKISTLDAGFIAYVTLCVILPITLSARTVTWWDDINFWASDLKSLYFLGGFAAKYTNVSPEFGDYPPAVQLAKWFIVHMDKSTFREELGFVGYYLFNLSFLMPLFKNIKGRRAWLGIPLSLIAWGFAGIGEIYGYSGFCADLSMAMLFGSVLICAVENCCGKTSDNVNGIMDMLKPALLLAVLVITKSTGFIWTFFGAVIWITVRLTGVTSVTSKKPVDKTGVPVKGIRLFLRELAVCIPAFITGGSWMLFCLLKRRVAKTTATMVTYMTTDDYALSAYKSDFAKAFIKGFFTEPLHLDRTWIDLPAAGIFVLIVVLLIIFRRKGYLPGKAGRFVTIFIPVMGLLYYIVIFISHLTMFATETQYLEAPAMAASIERYGAPFVVGTFLMLSYVWLNGAGLKAMAGQGRGDVRMDVSGDGSIAPADVGLNVSGGGAAGCADAMRLRVFVIAVIALTNIPAAFNGLIGYRNNEDVTEANAVKEAFIDEYNGLFIQCLEDEGITDKCISSGGVRVCRFRDGAYYRVADTYVAYAASPVSVLAPSLKLSDVDVDTFVYTVSQTHASYLYVDEQPYETDYLDEMTANGHFEYCKVYAIGYEDGMMKLYDVN